jgi:hypothetical protein
MPLGWGKDDGLKFFHHAGDFSSRNIMYKAVRGRRRPRENKQQKG